MIESFLKNEKEFIYSIIPKLKEFNELSLTHGDTLVVYWDFEKYPLDEASEFFKIVQKAFPHNQVLFLPLGSELGVTKNDYKSI